MFLSGMKMESNIILNAERLNFSTWTAVPYFYMMAYRLPVNEDEWGADIIDVSTLDLILLANKNTLLPSR